jgi:hypothetical protein
MSCYCGSNGACRPALQIASELDHIEAGHPEARTALSKSWDQWSWGAPPLWESGLVV